MQRFFEYFSGTFLNFTFSVRFSISSTRLPLCLFFQHFITTHHFQTLADRAQAAVIETSLYILTNWSKFFCVLLYSFFFKFSIKIFKFFLFELKHVFSSVCNLKLLYLFWCCFYNRQVWCSGQFKSFGIVFLKLFKVWKWGVQDPSNYGCWATK